MESDKWCTMNKLLTQSKIIKLENENEKLKIAMSEIKATVDNWGKDIPVILKDGKFNHGEVIYCDVERIRSIIDWYLANADKSTELYF